MTDLPPPLEPSVNSDPGGDTGSGTPQRHRTWLMLAPVVVVAVIGGFWLTGGRYQETEDATVQAGLVGIAADVSGKVIEVDVTENQQVKAGQVLFRINPDTAAANLDSAQAELAAARAAGAASQSDYAQSQADIAAAQARLSYAEGEAARQKLLVAQGISSQAQYDQAVTAVQTARAGVSSATDTGASRKAALGGRTAGPVDDLPSVRRAAAAVETARIALANTVVHAPSDGTVTHVNALMPGTYVTASRPVIMLAGARRWVEANFKESQLTHMRVGQSVTVTIDAFPSVTIHGHVTSFSPGTGSSFAVLPAENATGNWIKVVQRLPVEISLEDVPANLPLQAGLSADVEVDTQYSRHIFGGAGQP